MGTYGDSRYYDGDFNSPQQRSEKATKSTLSLEHFYIASTDQVSGLTTGVP
jgi:hypothetical protein